MYSSDFFSYLNFYQTYFFSLFPTLSLYLFFTARAYSTSRSVSAAPSPVPPLAPPPRRGAQHRTAASASSGSFGQPP